MGFRHNSRSMLQLFLLISSCFSLGFSVDTLRFNQSIRDSDFLVSNGQNLKFGFFSPGNNTHRYVGVMYNNISAMTVVWTANRDSPLNDSNGTVQISSDGNLVILDGQMGVVWSSNLSSSVTNSSVRLLDTGNLVLQNSDGRIVWQSFQHASDSFMPNMRIMTDLSTNERNMLTSWRSPNDPSLGSFTALIEPLQIPQLFIRNGSDPYWRSGPWNGQIFIGVPGMEVNLYQNGFDLVNDNPETAYLTFSYVNISVLTYFALNSSGNFQQKLLSHRNGDWEVTWSSIQNECDVYGKCGSFGSCNARDNPICTCLPGFEPKNIDEWNAANWSNGCTRRTPLQSERNDSFGEIDGFLELNRVKLPDNTRWSLTLEADCGSQCLNTSSCIAYAFYTGIGCMLWNESLIDVQKFSSGGADLYIRLAYSELHKKRNWTSIIATTVVLGFITISVCTLFCLKWYRADRFTRGHSIRDGETIISERERFALGFFSPQGSSVRYVGIWYYKVANEPVVWVANRETPVLDNGGALTIGNDGNLIVLNGDNNIIWSSK
ncbi:hypothetical protein BUALT_Bualt03G0068800 [Buddleja alternifolia]|uniref:non-specific serine/threonine protein kinase n=1 Tax=Buddleja alternifolia TaxID=168488 RepID=A0AAV6Y2Y2_9LAMI|nr:hypothetical protein BUALT_Bualt03G0068800 [Buddleja alternifolia]